MSSIYKITNIKSGSVYIGKTKNSIFKRFNEHISESEKGSKTKLYDAMRSYGVENFKVELIEDNIPEDLINFKEKYYIKEFDSLKNGYNMTPGGDGGPIRKGMKNSEEQKRKSSEAQRGKPKKNPGMCGKYEKGAAQRKKLSEAVLGRKWINNGSIQKQVKPEEVEELLKNGFVLGRLKSTGEKCSKKLKGNKKCNTVGGKVCITDKDLKEMKFINPEELESYLSQGWIKGMYAKDYIEKRRGKK